MTHAQKIEVLAELVTHSDPVGTSPDTTKNDKIRLMELRSLPGAQMLWTQAFGPKNRQLLDACRSHESDERDESLNPWNSLATLFNDREAFMPQNRACLYQDGVKKKVAVDESIAQAVVDQLYDLDPNEAVRPMRSGLWIKEKWTAMAREVYVISNNFFRSGNQKDDPKSLFGISEWVLSFASGNQVNQYAVLVLEVGVLKTMGKVKLY
jgi:hypothetical protein